MVLPGRFLVERLSEEENKMKKIKMLAVLILALFVLTACDSSAGSAPAGNSRTYTKTGTTYTDDSGETFYGNWTNRTTITGSANKMQVQVLQEEKLEGNYPTMVYETIYTFSKPISNVYFDRDSYTMVIVAQENTVVTTKMCAVRKENWTSSSAASAKIWVENVNDPANGSFYNGYTLKAGNQYRVFAEHYNNDIEFAGVLTYIDVK